jgi:hypothetical protein
MVPSSFQSRLVVVLHIEEGRRERENTESFNNLFFFFALIQEIMKSKLCMFSIMQYLLEL